jgi:hypothetical protein
MDWTNQVATVDQYLLLPFSSPLEQRLADNACCRSRSSSGTAVLRCPCPKMSHKKRGNSNSFGGIGNPPLTDTGYLLLVVDELRLLQRFQQCHSAWSRAKGYRIRDLPLMSIILALGWELFDAKSQIFCFVFFAIRHYLLVFNTSRI